MRCNLCFQRIFHRRGLKLRLCTSCIKDIDPVLYCRNVVTKERLNYQCTVLFTYNKTIRQVVNLFKFSKEIKLAHTFISLVLENLNLINWPDIIIPVPSHPINEIKRGFSHMAYVAHLLSEKLDIPFDPALVRKVFPILKHSQKRKSRKERIKGIDRFYLKPNAKRVKNKKILLIDDVVTTGSSMNECAEILLTNGASKVSGVGLALTPF